MKLTRMISITAAVGFCIFGASCSRPTQSADTTPLPSSTPQGTQGGTQSTGSTQSGTNQQTTATGQKSDNQQTNGGTSENDIVTPQTDTPAAADTASATPATATATRSTKTCLDELQGRFGPDIVFPAQQLFPKQYDAARAQGAGGAAALKQTLAGSTCDELKAKE